ncbi:PQQ-dependent sugar dehydrogenase [Paenibacillus mendelii]|uniref:PQQ-dependent sugar dehydrogenase n=1 Tax=Paenibacillus mendelii TaxID=206163 RepID=A0ABV6JC53_9BACL|nr:PQQ-dependent sugar dehydrogenase [Paenibacillus mendelii]MCQ6562739.1 PQQ-dependent sugar dehydrogenase [Paenibacillus mendelii]
MNRILFISMLAVLLLVGAACTPAQKKEAIPVEVGSGSAVTSEGKGKSGYDTLAERLQSPWAIDFAGDTIYVSEREGTIAKIADGKLERQTVSLDKPVKQIGEGGFLGFVLAPDFAKTKQAYAYHTYEDKGDEYNRIVLLEEAADGSSWTEKQALLERIPGASVHNGGRLAIGPDNHLYATTGDASREKLAQDLNSLAGKILRMSMDGTAPSDNPFPDSLVYSYGHRNPQGLAWNSKGELISAEHGPSSIPGGHDELNRIEAGGNYGWPEIIGDEKKKGMITPVFHTGNDTLAPSGITINEHDEILVTGLRGQSLVRFSPDASSSQVMVTSEGRLRDVKIHKGMVYVITNNTDGRGDPGNTDDRLLRLK